MLKAEYLHHPKSPGVRVMVVRGFWGRMFKNAKFATAKEVATYHAFKRGVKHK